MDPKLYRLRKCQEAVKSMIRQCEQADKPQHKEKLEKILGHTEKQINQIIRSRRNNN